MIPVLFRGRRKKGDYEIVDAKRQSEVLIEIEDMDIEEIEEDEIEELKSRHRSTDLTQPGKKLKNSQGN